MKEYPATYQHGYISIENMPDSNITEGDLGIQIASDGRIWVCINGAAFIRFKPILKVCPHRGKEGRMGRYSVQYSKGHRCHKFGVDDFRISWVVDRYYTGSRLRFPTTYSRDTDEAGAKRFCKKHGIDFDKV